MLQGGGVLAYEHKKEDNSALPSNLIPPEKFGRMRTSSSPAFLKGCDFPPGAVQSNSFRGSNPEKIDEGC